MIGRLSSLIVGLCLIGTAQPALAAEAGTSESGVPGVSGGLIVLAQAQGTRDGDLEPRYQPREPEDPDAYNNDYIFAMTRGVSNAAIAPAGKVPLYIFSIPIDIALLPFALIGGLFG